MLAENHKAELEQVDNSKEPAVKETPAKESPALYGTFISVLCVLAFIILSWSYIFYLFSERQ